MHLTLLFPCNFIIENQKYLRGYSGQASRPLEICGPRFAKNVLEDCRWDTDIKIVQLYVRERADGWKDGNDRETDRPIEKK